GGEDLAPGVVALEGREVAAVGEALETLLPARAPRARRDELEGRPHRRGDPPEARRQVVRNVRVVAPEELVPTLARERDFDVLRRQFRDQVGGEGRVVCERLVERLDDLR